MARPKGIRKTARLSVSLEDKAHRSLQLLAEQDDVTISWLIRRAVNEMIKRRGPKAEAQRSARKQVQNAGGAHGQV